MLRAKVFADLLTGLRAGIALSLIWLGLNQGASALELAVFLILIGWISDYFDGALARRSAGPRSSWLGIHDLEVDMLAALGLLIYMAASGFISTALAYLYVLFWLFIFWRRGIDKAYGSLFQAPVYGYLLWLAYLRAPQALTWVLAWFVLNLAFTWRRFAIKVLPDFFAGLRSRSQQK